MGRGLPDDLQAVEGELGALGGLFQLCARDTQSDLHDQCDRVGQQRAEASDKESRIVSYGRGGAEIDISGARESLAEMDDACEELAWGDQPVCNPV